MKEVSLPPTAATLMESTRSIGYSFESAISDIVDNSISAHASKIWIYSAPSNDPSLSILDNGDGMSSFKLQEAMRYGANPNVIRSTEDLGRFGLGMKMASLSQCRCLTVASKTQDSYAVCRWDLDRVIEADQWILQILSHDEVNNLPQIEKLDLLDHGTLVCWTNLDKIKERAVSIEKTMNDCLLSSKHHLRLVFHRFMETNNNPIKIFFNNDELIPFDPFLTSNSLTAPMQEERISIGGEVISVKPYILPPESKMKQSDIEKIGGIQRTLQGFWIYRNKRLIIPGTWFKLAKSKELTKLARVRVDIPNTLDSLWDIDVKKSTATVPVQFQTEFENVLDRVITKSERKYRYRGRKESDGGKNFIWNKISYDGSYIYEVNRSHPLIVNAMCEMNEVSRDAFLDVIELIEQSIPYYDIFCTMGEAKLGKMKSTDDYQNDLIAKGIRLLESGAPISSICNSEPFMNDPVVIKKLEEFDIDRQSTRR